MKTGADQHVVKRIQETSCLGRHVRSLPVRVRPRPVPKRFAAAAVVLMPAVSYIDVERSTPVASFYFHT